MREVVIISYNHRTFTVLLLSLACCWLFALVEAQKSPPQCDLVGQIRPGNEEHHNGSCAIVNLTNIEVCESDGWRELCDTDLSDKDAQVICRELGYSDIGAAAGTFPQRIGGFPATRFPVCNGSEQNLSLCAMPDHNGTDCTVNKLFVTCFLPGTDATMCGISTEPHSTTSDESTASSTTPEPLHPPTQVTDLSTSTSTSQSPGVTTRHSHLQTIHTSTRKSGANQSINHTTMIIIIGAAMGVIVFFLIVLCMTLVCLCCKSLMFKANVQRNENTTPHMRENMAYNIICLSETRRNPSLCSEVTNNATKDHQEMPIYEVIAENSLYCQDTSKVSAH